MTKLAQIITILGNARTAGGMSDEDVALQIMRDCGFEEEPEPASVLDEETGKTK